MSTHNIGFYEEISKIIPYHQISNTHLISSSNILTDEIDLQGSVKMHTVQIFSNLRNYTSDFGPAETTASFDSLNPNTVYTVTVTITIHGGAFITSDPVTVKTLDGGNCYEQPFLYRSLRCVVVKLLAL